MYICNTVSLAASTCISFHYEMGSIFAEAGFVDIQKKPFSQALLPMLKFFPQILKVLQCAFSVVFWYLLLELLKTKYCVTVS